MNLMTNIVHVVIEKKVLSKQRSGHEWSWIVRTEQIYTAKMGQPVNRIPKSKQVIVELCME